MSDKNDRTSMLWLYLLIALILLVVFLATRTARSEDYAGYCPEIYLECPDRDVDESRDLWILLEDLGAEGWELHALRVITSDLRGKEPLDVVRTDCGSSGWAHRRPNEGCDGFNMGICSTNECPYRDQEWRDWVLALLMWDMEQNQSRIQFHTWRRIISLAVDRAPRRCRQQTDCMITLTAIANSTPSRAAGIGRGADWDPDAMLEEYIRRNPTRHREGRARRVREQWAIARAERRAERRRRREQED